MMKNQNSSKTVNDNEIPYRLKKRAISTILPAKSSKRYKKIVGSEAFI